MECFLSLLYICTCSLFLSNRGSMTLCSPSFKNFNKVVPQKMFMVVNVICCVGLARLFSITSSQKSFLFMYVLIAVSIVQECLMKTHDHMQVGVQGLKNLAFSNTLRSLLRAIASLVPRSLPLHGGGETPWYTLLVHAQIIPLVK